MGRLVKAERFHEIVLISDRECEVRTWDNQCGPVAYPAKWMYGKVLEEKFAGYCEELKKYCEAQAKTASQTAD